MALVRRSVIVAGCLVSMYSGGAYAASWWGVDDEEDAKSDAPLWAGEGSAEYSEEEARVYLEYARATFCDKGAVEAWSCGGACDRTHVVKGTVRYLGPGASTHIAGYVAELPTHPMDLLTGRRCIVAFRGSAVPRNWAADFRFFPVEWPPERDIVEDAEPLDEYPVEEDGTLLPGRLRRLSADYCPGCKVHSGFAAAYEEMRPQMLQALQELQCKEVDVVGHSLGGAVATFGIIDLRAELKIPVNKAYTFGSPRIGNTAFVKAFREAAAYWKVDPPVWRLVHYRDPVPRIPIPAFVHVPREVYYETQLEDKYRICSSRDGEDPTCTNTRYIHRAISLDHLTYLNQSFRQRDFPPECNVPVPTSPPQSWREWLPFPTSTVAQEPLALSAEAEETMGGMKSLPIVLLCGPAFLCCILWCANRSGRLGHRDKSSMNGDTATVEMVSQHVDVESAPLLPNGASSPRDPIE